MLRWSNLITTTTIIITTDNQINKRIIPVGNPESPVINQFILMSKYTCNKPILRVNKGHTT